MKKTIHIMGSYDEDTATWKFPEPTPTFLETLHEEIFEYSYDDIYMKK